MKLEQIPSEKRPIISPLTENTVFIAHHPIICKVCVPTHMIQLYDALATRQPENCNKDKKGFSMRFSQKRNF